MKQNQNQKIKKLILLSVILGKKQKYELIDRLENFSSKQLNKLKVIFKEEQEIKNQMISEHFQQNPESTINYTRQINKIINDSFKKAEIKNRTEENPELILNTLDKI